jgi:hypothetical protein
LRLGFLTVGCLLVFAGWVGTAWAELTVSRHAFAREVVAREPVAAATTFPPDVGEVYFFTQIVGAMGRAELLHIWIYDGRELAIVPLTVEGRSWRTWSSKRILPQFIGDWTVEVRAVGGEVLLSATFRVE